jgi:hypothetical protein
MIEFPRWVQGPTKCWTRTFSTVIPRTNRRPETRHGAIRIVTTHENRPTKMVRRKGLPGYYTTWK